MSWVKLHYVMLIEVKLGCVKFCRIYLHSVMLYNVLLSWVCFSYVTLCYASYVTLNRVKSSYIDKGDKG